MSKILLSVVLFMVSCSGPGFFTQQLSSASSISNVIEDLGDGAIQTTIYATSDSSQTIEMTDSDELSGASITINPGTLAISTSMVMEEADDLLSGSFLTDLDLDDAGTIEESSAPLLVEPEESVNPIGSLVISLPVSSTSLFLTTHSYAVVYEVFDYENNRYLKGVIPSSDIVVSDDLATFETDYFGTFQVVKPQNQILTKKEVESDTKPKSKRAVSGLDTVTLNKPVMTLVEASRELQMSLATSDDSSLVSCILFLDDNKLLPYRSKKVWNLESSMLMTPYEQSVHDTYAKLECKDSNDRRLSSEWSELMSVPAAPMLSLDALAPLGSHNVTAYPLSGSCSYDGETINISGSVTASALCSNGQYATTIDYSGEADGVINIQLDHGLNAMIANSIMDSVTKDTAAPTVTGVSTSHSVLNLSLTQTASDLISGAAASEASTFKYQLVLNGATCSSQNSYSSTIPKSNDPSISHGASYQVCVQATDAGGNVGYGQSNAINVDKVVDITTAAVLYSPIAADGLFLANEYGAVADIISTPPSGSDVSSVEYALTTNSNCSSVTWTTAIPTADTLTDGQYIMCYKVTDVAANEYIDSNFSFLVDVTSPNITNVSSPTSIDELTSSNVIVTGDCTENMNIDITTPNGNDVFLCTSGTSFSRTYDFSAESSSVTIHFNGTDLNGNGMMATFSNAMTINSLAVFLSSSVSMSNNKFVPGDIVSCDLSSSTDANGNVINVSYEWQDGSNAPTYQIQEFDRGSSIDCQATLTSSSSSSSYVANSNSQNVDMIENQCASPNTAASGYDSGDGSSGFPYVICDKAQAQNISPDSNEYILGTDIDLSGGYWTPIGDSSGSSFAGKFHGNGKTLSNLDVQGDGEDGFFGRTDSGLRFLMLSLKTATYQVVVITLVLL